MEQNKGNSLDRFRLIAAGLVIANHTSLLALISPTADFILTRILARLAVPFFFLLTGYFVLSRRKESALDRRRRIYRWCRHILMLYGIAIVLYFPINLYAKQLSGNFLDWIRILWIDGTFYHLWYFPAVLIGVVLVNELDRFLSPKGLWLIGLVLYCLALGADSYYGLVSQISFLDQAYDQLFLLMESGRNGFLFAPLFLIMGKQIKEKRSQLSLVQAKAGLTVCLLLLIAEGLILHWLGWQRFDVMYGMLIPTSYFLFQLGLVLPGTVCPSWRRVSMLVYLLHPMMILVVRLVGKIPALHSILVENNLILFLLTAMLSYGTSFFLVWAWKQTRPLSPSQKGRSWIEINAQALRHNIETMQQLLPSGCKIMGVVKAQAYGHGGEMIAKLMEQNGIDFFAVATVAEAVELREQGIIGEILILGYTAPEDFPCLIQDNLIQTVLDLDYARLLNRFSKKIRVHVAIDTGMHRLGEDWHDFSSIAEIWAMKSLKIEGIFTHLCVADSLAKEDQEFTRLQIQRFDQVCAQLKKNKMNPGIRHVQSSYGVLNYPDLHYDYVRLGIALLGTHSQNDLQTRCRISLEPVLTLKTRIAAIKTIPEGDTVGYGRTFQATKKTRIAVLPIGYADGLDRRLSGLSVQLHQQQAKIIGRICMDQCMIDVTGIQAACGEEVILIGPDLPAAQWAEDNQTITNEVLSRLSARLPRILLPSNENKS